MATPNIFLGGDRLDDIRAGLPPATFFICLFCLVSSRVARCIEVSGKAIAIPPAGLRIAPSEIGSVRGMSKSALHPNAVLHKMKITTRGHRWRRDPVRLHWFTGKITRDLCSMEDGHAFARELGVDLSDSAADTPRRGG